MAAQLRVDPLEESETGLQPHLTRVVSLHLVDIINSILIIPISAKPPPNTSPNISCVVRGIAGERPPLTEIVCPSLVASADDAIHIFGAERCIISAHRPCRFTIYVFDLEKTVTLVTAWSIPGTWRTETSI